MLIGGIVLGLILGLLAGGRFGNLASIRLRHTWLLLIAVMLRSAYVTEKNGGITWRGTFYPLELLRRRPVPPEPVG